MYRFIVAFSLMISSYIALAVDEKPDLSAALNNLFTFQADFSQVVTTNDGAILEESAGRILIARPGHFLWEVNKPSNIQIIANYDENHDYVLWYYDRDLQQASVQPFEQTVERTPAMLLSGAITNLNELYTITTEESGNNNIYTLMPKAEDSSLQSITIMLDKNQHVKEIRLRDASANDTRISFNNIKAIDRNSFEPKFDANTDIVDHRS